MKNIKQIYKKELIELFIMAPRNFYEKFGLTQVPWKGGFAGPPHEKTTGN